MAELRPDRTLGQVGAYWHDTFWEWTAKGELRLQKCGNCGEFAWPVVKACECCGGGEFDWARMSGKGKLVSWCTFERDYNRGMLPIPWDTILVELEEGALFIGNPQGFSWAEMAVGMLVTVEFIPCKDTAGEFALPVFRKA